MSTAKNPRDPKKSRALLIGGVLLAAVVGGYLASSTDRQGELQAASGPAKPGEFQYAVGTPTPGQTAPDFYRKASDGSNFSLADYRGKTVMLYFHEGSGCQPCWDQIKDIEKNWAQFEARGIDAFVSISGDPLSALQRKVKLEELRTPVLSDPGMEVSSLYTTNKYGMMGEGYNGHSFILVGPEGRIQWRADYGGAPQYNMFVPVPNLMADMHRDMQEGS